MAYSISELVALFLAGVFSSRLLHPNPPIAIGAWACFRRRVSVAADITGCTWSCSSLQPKRVLRKYQYMLCSK